MAYIGWALTGALAVAVVVLFAIIRANRPKAAPVGSERNFALARSFFAYAPGIPDQLSEWFMGLREADFALVYSELRTDMDAHDTGQERSPMLIDYILSMTLLRIDPEGERYLRSMTIEEQRRILIALEKA